MVCRLSWVGRCCVVGGLGVVCWVSCLVCFRFVG